MCGICGVVYRDRERIPEPTDVARMRDAMRHRGPDEAGIWTDKGVGLGHRRLRIIDLASGQQPLSNEDGQIQVVFNGEIYNFRTLRNQLQASGHKFASRSDTEVIVHLYEEVGSDFPRHLEGMFAIALWDQRKRSLWLARDHLGKKPLHYYEDSEKLVFASDLHAIREYPGVNIEVAEEAILDFLHLGYIPAPATIYRQVRKLMPGHAACWQGELRKPKAYWTLPAPSVGSWSWPEACDAFRERFEDAVRRRLVSDVPLGAFLSGGLDSSAVVAAMCRVAEKPIRTFTIGFGERSHDESADARRVAEYLGTDHVELTAEAPTIDLLPQIVRFMDEPMADSSALPTFLVCRLAREYVTVALSGDGGDELLGGYRRYFPDRRDQRFLRLPPGLRNRLARMARSFPRWMPAREYLQYIGLDSLSRYSAWIRLTTRDRLRGLLHPELACRLDHHNPQEWLRKLDTDSGANHPAHRFTYIDYHSYLLNDILVKVDRMSMASSLEVRCPLLDRQLVELVSTFPPEFRASQDERKRVLRAVAGPWLPPGTLDKPKHGFSVPIAAWFRRAVGGQVETVLLDPAARTKAFVEERAVRALIDDHRTGRGDHSSLLWALMCLELWLGQTAPQRWETEAVGSLQSSRSRDLAGRCGPIEHGAQAGR